MPGLGLPGGGGAPPPGLPGTVGAGLELGAGGGGRELAAATGGGFLGFAGEVAGWYLGAMVSVMVTGIRCYSRGSGAEGRVVSPHAGLGPRVYGGGGDVTDNLERLFTRVVHSQHLLPSQSLVRTLLHHSLL